MSVYTALSLSDVRQFIAAYDVGQMVEFHPISEGIENTNYFVDTDRGRFVLTIFESTPADGLAFYLDLMAFLADRGIPSAHPIADHQGCYLSELKKKPAALVKRLSGASVELPSDRQAFAIGKLLAEMHAVSTAFPEGRADDRGQQWRRDTAAGLMGEIPPADYQLLCDELTFQQSTVLDELPSGVIHADLFRDNALFENNHVSGVIDFYYAHSGPFIYDLAVTAADWGFIANGETLNEPLVGELLHGYQSERRLTAGERSEWLRYLRLAALRFWLSRLHDSQFPRPGAVTQIKDPVPFRRLLQDCRSEPEKYRQLVA